MTRNDAPPAPVRADRRVPAALAVVLALFATGVGGRPDGALWALAYDLVLYNAVYVLAAVWAWRSAAAVRGAGRWLAAGLVLNGAGNVLYTLQDATQAQPPTPSVADVLCLAFYPFLYVALVRLVRTRAPRFGARMWLDGLIGASGAAAVAIAVLLAPALTGVYGHLAEYATNLAFPVADVLLLALLVGIGGALGLRTDRVLLTVCAGLGLHLLGDVVYLNLQALDRYVEGGPLDLTWLLGVALVARGVQPSALPTRAARAATTRDLVEWRVLAVPVGCSVASVALLAVGWGDRLPVSVACCAVACLVTVVVRTVLTFREMRRLREVGREARTDDLTGLPNRRALYERAEVTIAAATAERPMALLLLDLDGFKQVNDEHGHGAGDELLRQVGARMLGTLRPADAVARLGGDEFAVVLPDTDVEQARRVAGRLREVLDQPFVVRGDELRVGGSIGIATGPGSAGTVDTLMQRADEAMYAAKVADDGVRIRVAGDGAGRDDLRRDGAALRTALASGDVTVHVQPQVSLVDGRTVGVEALVRWEHPSRGLLGPDELLPLAARTGLQRLLTETVLDLSLAGAARWWSHRAPLPVAVNLALADVADVDLSRTVTSALERHGLSPRALTLEVTEDALARDGVSTALGGLRAVGVSVAVDDYGSGHSSLLELRRLPADELKLDPALVADVATDDRVAAIARHTIALAHALGMRVVAEGAEDGTTVTALADLGCDVVQGFEIAPSMPVDDFVTWLRGRPVDGPVRQTSVALPQAWPARSAATSSATPAAAWPPSSSPLPVLPSPALPRDRSQPLPHDRVRVGAGLSG